MKAWRIDRLGGTLSLVERAVPALRPGSVLVRLQAQSLMSYLRPYLEGALPAYRAPEGFTPGGNGVGIIEAVGDDVWHLGPGQRVILSSHLVARENVQKPGQILLGVTSPGGAGDALQASWKDGTLAEYALVPAHLATPLEGLDHLDPVRLAVLTRLVVPYGGLLRGRLAAGETVIVNGATGAYGTAAVFVAIAMGAARVVAAGRNGDVLRRLAEAAGPLVRPVALTGDVAADTARLRDAAGGGAPLALDMIGGASDAGSTRAALGALHRGGRLVMTGSAHAPLPLDYLQMMFNTLEVLGNFMHPADAHLRLAALVRSGRLSLDAIATQAFALPDLDRAMTAAAEAGSLEMVVVTS
ncbi:zinc-binding alcohol dehydrogenase family protein [Paroceanicella profunda]|uniref:Zinc-binding alcohol dehydrogenase family protein n=1 Tax=Paroceanicella profunda TaxID=2579971 RepID=A0A5B8FHY4_9RHOB|nr:zinc-binding alcohol dehydrogenase family protein [Paroceanicella profunda]QDL92488.1 zinc-binding alcohol dehydrogenase family protein [Paroceanicella profunda]